MKKVKYYAQWYWCYNWANKKCKAYYIGPREDSVNECTELITPDLVKKVPKIHRVNVKIIKTIVFCNFFNYINWSF